MKILLLLVIPFPWSKPLKNLAADLGVSDTAIRKMAIRRQIEIPPRGFWLRK